MAEHNNNNNYPTTVPQKEVVNGDDGRRSGAENTYTHTKKEMFVSVA